MIPDQNILYVSYFSLRGTTHFAEIGYRLGRQKSGWIIQCAGIEVYWRGSFTLLTNLLLQVLCIAKCAVLGDEAVSLGWQNFESTLHPSKICEVFYLLRTK